MNIFAGIVNIMSATLLDRLPILCIATGILLFLAWPPFPFAFLLFIAFVPLLKGTDLILTKYSNSFPYRKAWLFGYASLFLWNATTTWWVSLSTLGGGIFALLVNTLIMTLPYMLFVWTRRRIGNQASWIMLITGWIAYEYFHMRWELTWPWLTLGNGFAVQHTWIQWYEYTGVYGGTAWILLVNILVYRAWYFNSKKNALLSLAAIILPLIASFIIYSNTAPDGGEEVEVALLQTNFNPHTEKFDLPVATVLNSMLELSETGIDSTLDYLVWPETALPENIHMKSLSNNPSLNKIRFLLQEYPNLNVITGINAYNRYNSIAEAEEPETVRVLKSSKGDIYLNSYNTAILLDGTSEVQYYHKGKLVPGPEIYPYYKNLQWLNKLIPGLENYMGLLSTGPTRHNLIGKDGTASATAICYESVFGEFVTGYVKNGADIIFVITNDGWWGDSPGRKQHKAYAKLRAIENRRDVARSANTGISCFINQRGDIVSDAGTNNAQVLRGTMYKNTKETVYVRNGDVIGRTSIWIAIALFSVTLVRTLQARLKP
ncbi:MAG: apolipoprotein N-acyltransferase [Limisphaerales bacterium]|jgi:apolipoprotein N-acyltransferase